MTKLYLPDGAYNACMTTVVIAIVLFVFGASMGSFSSALLYRVHSGEGDMLTGRSKCPGCEKQLLWYHMFPVISYLALGGKCGMCEKIIPRRYLFLEIIFGLVFSVFGTLLLVSGHFYALSFGLMLFVLFVMCFLAFYDALYQEVPDSVVVSSILFFLLVFAVDVHFAGVWHYIRPVHISTVLEGLVASVCVYAFFAVQNVIAGLLYFVREGQLARIVGFLVGFLTLPFWWTVKVVFGERYADYMFPTLSEYDDVPAWVGGGDLRFGVFLGFVSGLYLSVAGLIFGYILGSIFGVYLITQGKRDQHIPLVPFLAGGWLVGVVYMTVS